MNKPVGATITPAQLPGISEAEFLAQVKELAKVCGWLLYHTRDSRGSDAGFPDLVLVREKNGTTKTIVAELKTEKGKVSPAQAQWLQLLEQSGITSLVWRPSSNWEAYLI